MSINNDRELRKAAEEAGAILQEIQDYVGYKQHNQAVTRFPRGYLRTAESFRKQFQFLDNVTLKKNISYLMMLYDSTRWLLWRTDIAGTPKEMLIKLQIFIAGTFVESITKEYLKGKCGKGYKERTRYLYANEVIESDLKKDLDWIWDMRNNMHLFLLSEPEYVNKYNQASLERCTGAVNSLISKMNSLHTEKGKPPAVPKKLINRSTS